MIPLYKSGDKTNPSNYRPISILSVISKIVEKAILNRLKKFCDKYNIMNEQQFGFRKGYSTSLAIASVHENLLSALDNGLTTCNVFIDLKKAFDSVDHDILISKLQFYGIRGNALNLLMSYLSNRSQCVEINGKRSNCQALNYGVPQDSVLGPFLILLYINHFENTSSIKLTQFPDDILLYLSSKNLTSLEYEVLK